MTTKAQRTDRDIKNLFIGKEKAGTITRDHFTLTIKIRVAALTFEQEQKLRAFAEEMLYGQ